MKRMNVIKFIGFGEVVKSFMDKNQELIKKFKVEVYTRKTNRNLNTSSYLAKFFDLDTFSPDESIVIVAASTDEELALRTAGSSSRMMVANENLAIVQELLDKKVFSKGTVFVLKNPVEVVANYIFSKSGNKNIYAFGHYNDILRIKNILDISGSQADKIKALGFHYLNPIPGLKNQNDSSIISQKQLESFDQKYEALVKSAFKGFKPPIDSGIINLEHLFKALLNKGQVYVSGYNKCCDSFLLGSLDAGNFSFHANKPSTRLELLNLQEKVKRHKDFYSRLGEL